MHGDSSTGTRDFFRTTDFSEAHGIFKIYEKELTPVFFFQNRENELAVYVFFLRKSRS